MLVCLKRADREPGKTAHTRGRSEVKEQKNEDLRSIYTCHRVGLAC